MGVKWLNSRARHQNQSFILCPPDQCVLILTAPDEHAQLRVHWSEKHNGSFPCMGEGQCPLCPGRSWIACYAPAAVWNGSVKQWALGILPLGSPDEILAADDHTEMLIRIGKKSNATKYSPTVFKAFVKELAQVDPKPQLEAFDVRPHLLRRWGLYRDADAIAGTLRVREPEALLPFSQEESA